MNMKRTGNIIGNTSCILQIVIGPETSPLQTCCYGPPEMWEQYKKTLVWTQLVILMVSVLVYFAAHRVWQMAALYFVTMQLFAVLGAAWALRLKRKILRSPP